MARALVTIFAAIALSLVVPASAWSATAAPLAQPNWSELTPQQQQILAPLAKDWDGFGSPRRMKWLGIAKRYPAMEPEQQQRIQTQMKPWASLTPEARNAARANFKKGKKESKETQEQREARRKKWEQYQALPESEKNMFREKAAKKKPPKKPLTPPVKLVVPALSNAATAK